MVDWAGGAGFDPESGQEAPVMATILFTDIVDSTSGARRRRRVMEADLSMHDDVVRSVLAGFRGRDIETAGDSFLVVFDSAESAIRCGLALVEALSAMQLPIRVGIHSGEVVVSDDQVRGLAVHTAARIVAEAGAGKSWCRASPATSPKGPRDWRSISGPPPPQGPRARARAVRCGIVRSVAGR